MRAPAEQAVGRLQLPLHLGQCLLWVRLRKINPPEDGVRTRVLRVEFEDLLEVRCCFLQPTGGVGISPKIAVVRHAEGVQLYCPAIQRYGFFKATEGGSQLGSVPDNRGVARLQGQCSLVGGVCSRPVPVVARLDPPYGRMGLCQVRIQRQSLLRRLPCLLVALRCRQVAPIRLTVASSGQHHPCWA